MAVYGPDEGGISPCLFNTTFSGRCGELNRFATSLTTGNPSRKLTIFFGVIFLCVFYNSNLTIMPTFLLKKKKGPAGSTKVVYSTAQKKADQTYAADAQKAKSYDEGVKKQSSKFSGSKGTMTNPERQKDLAASRSYAGTKSGKSYNEQARVEGLKQTGYYDAKPHVVGGTKSMLKKSKANVRKNSASPAAKQSAKRLY